MKLSDMVKNAVGSAYAWWVGAPREPDQTRRTLLLGLPTAVGVVTLLDPGLFGDLLPPEEVEPIPLPEEPVDIYTAARSAGKLIPNQFWGLGAISLRPGQSAELCDTYQDSLWVKRVILDSDSPNDLYVESITIGGMPIFTGDAPLSAARKSPSGAHIIECSQRMLVQRGQRVVVRVTNRGTAAIVASGGVVGDSLRPGQP